MCVWYTKKEKEACQIFRYMTHRLINIRETHKSSLNLVISDKSEIECQ